MDQNPYAVGHDRDPVCAGLSGAEFSRSVRRMQTIAGALILSVLTYLGVVLAIVQGDAFGMQNASILTMVGAGFGLVMMINHFAIPGVMSRAQLKHAAAKGLPEQDEIAAIQQVCGFCEAQLIIGLALLEGAAFFNLTALTVEKSVVSLGIVILLLGLMAVKFPTHDKVSLWVKDKLREMRQM